MAKILGWKIEMGLLLFYFCKSVLEFILLILYVHSKCTVKYILKKHVK